MTVGLKWKGLACVKHKQGGGEEQECVDNECQMRLKTWNGEHAPRPQLTSLMFNMFEANKLLLMWLAKLYVNH